MRAIDCKGCPIDKWDFVRFMSIFHASAEFCSHVESRPSHLQLMHTVETVEKV
jgi:hypothetical protein